MAYSYKYYLGNKSRTDQVRRHKMRALVNYLGGKCRRCGYKKCVAALDFHHKDPKTKRLLISQSLTMSIEVLIEEADKCELLCANCHRELHYNANR